MEDVCLFEKERINEGRGECTLYRPINGTNNRFMITDIREPAFVVISIPEGPAIVN